MILIKPLKAIVLGAPGAGKGTVLSKINKYFDNQIITISTGDLLRQHINQELSSEIASLISSGKLVPDKLILDMLLNKMKELNLRNDQSWIIDGFPRTLNQAKLLDQNLELNSAIQLDVPFEVILSRIENRYIHKPSGRIYNLLYNPPKILGKDDVTGEPLSKRPDDTVEVFQKRLHLYSNMISPLKAFYSEKGMLDVISGETSDIVSEKLIERLSSKYGVTK